MVEAGHAEKLAREWGRSSSSVFRALITDLADTARALEQNLTDAEKEAARPTWRQEEEARETRGAPLIAAAQSYSNAALQWLSGVLPASAGSSTAADPAGIEAGSPQAKRDALRANLKVVKRDCFLTPSKLGDGLNFWAYDTVEMDGELLTLRGNYKGSVKVALVGMDRSLCAWEELRQMLGDEAWEVPGLSLQLIALRQDTEQFFPEARAFVRPGFDEPCHTADSKP